MEHAPVPQPDAPAAPRPRSNRGFWILAGGFLVAAIVVAVGAIVTRPDPLSRDVVTNLDAAADAAQIVRDERGTWGAATPEELGVVDLQLRFVEGTVASNDPTTISVAGTDGRWLGVARADDGVCRAIEVDDTGRTRSDLPQVDPCSANATAAFPGGEGLAR
ncbi:MAG: hypothetical protein WD556_06105 [Actinomycetota bacterium]